MLDQLCAELSLDRNFQHKLDVIEGDLAQERLGLSDRHYTTLCSCVDIVIHNGAVVNAVLPYASKVYSLINTLLWLWSFTGLHFSRFESYQC